MFALPKSSTPITSNRLRIILIALCLGSLAATLTMVAQTGITYQGVFVGDIGAPLLGMDRFLAGTFPYGIQISSGPLTAYPFTTMLGVAPLLLFPYAAAAPLFNGLSTAILIYALLTTGPWWRLLLIVSPPFISALLAVQWSVLFTAALLLPYLLPLAVVKPQLGIVLLVNGRWTRYLLAAAAGIVGLSFLLYPHWLRDWLGHGAFENYTGRVPVLVVPGMLLVLAVRYWRVPRARLLLAMSVVSQRLWYDQLPLLLLPKTHGQMLILLVSSWIGEAFIRLGGWHQLVIQGDQPFPAWVAVIVTLYLPCLALLVWQQRTQPSV